MEKVLVTGLTGQDGSYMADYLLNNYADIEVYGMVRRTAQVHDINFRHLLGNHRLKIVRGDLLDSSSLNGLVQSIKPDYFINFAAQSFVGDSWKIPEETFIATAVGVLKCLEAIRNYGPRCRFYNAGSSEQFGDVIYSPQDEGHPFRPRSPYGAAKCAAHHLVKVYRESYNLYAVQGMLFNHESERRGEEFVTRKITKGFARIAKALQDGLSFKPIYLGNLDAKRDWSHALDFMDAVWRMLNQDTYRLDRVVFDPKDWDSLIAGLREYVVASGQHHTIRDFIKVITDSLEYDCFWQGTGENERLLLKREGTPVAVLIQVDAQFYRPADVNTLLGTPEAAIKELGWKPKIPFDKMTKRMLESDLYDAGVSSSGPSKGP